MPSYSLVPWAEDTTPFDTLYVNVLEHIGDDRSELRKAAEHLKPSGRLIVLAPPHMWLYSDFERSIGHYRRYSVHTLRAVELQLQIRAAFYLDSFGMLASEASRPLPPPKPHEPILQRNGDRSDCLRREERPGDSTHVNGCRAARTLSKPSPVGCDPNLESGRPGRGHTQAARGRRQPSMGDDASTDDTVSRVAERFLSVRIIRREQNGGFGAAVNTGFQAARGDYLATVNNDALVSWPSFEALLAFLDATPDAAAAAPRIRNPAGAWQQTGFTFPQGPRGWVQQHLARRQLVSAASPTEPCRADYLRGACLVFRRAALQEVGLFDEQFFMFAEELDLFRRLAAAGWSAWVVPGAVAEHSGGKSSRGHEDRAISSRFRRMSYRSMSLYYRKRHWWPTAVLLRAILATRVAGRLARALARSPMVPTERWWVQEHAACLVNVVRPCASRPREARLTQARQGRR